MIEQGFFLKNEQHLNTMHDASRVIILKFVNKNNYDVMIGYLIHKSFQKKIQKRVSSSEFAKWNSAVRITRL